MVKEGSPEFVCMRFIIPTLQIELYHNSAFHCTAGEYARALDNYKSRRPGVRPGTHLANEQRKQMMFEYMNVIMSRELNPKVRHTGSVQALADKWGKDRRYFRK